MADWDDDEFEPEDPIKTAIAPRTDKWDGEDEEEDIKDAWDDSDDETKAKPEAETTGKATERKKKKRNINEIMAEKEAKQREELELKRKQAEEENLLSTPEGKLAEKLRLQRLEEERELELAKDMMGVSGEGAPPPCGINFNPTTEEEFTELRNTLINELRETESSEHYQEFGIELIKSISMNLTVASLKRVKSEVEAMVSAKLKEERANKSKKGKPAKATIKMETDRSMFGRGLDDGYNDMDDFM